MKSGLGIPKFISMMCPLPLRFSQSWYCQGRSLVKPNAIGVLQVTTSKWTQDFPLHQETLTIGRHPQCDIVIDLPVVSQRHARLSWNNETYTLTALGSTHGLTSCWGKRSRTNLYRMADFFSIQDEVTLTYQVIPQTRSPLNRSKH